MTTLCIHYSDAELAAIYDFMAGSIEVMQQEIVRLRAKMPHEERG
ncbi:MAG: hypothetical protein ABIV47_05880 [Roseiflexaceae bacterium]